MQTLTVQLTHESALKTLHSLEEKRFIRIVDDADFSSPSLPGSSSSLKAFKGWIKDAENTNTLSLKEAKSKWSAKRKHLQKLTR